MRPRVWIVDDEPGICASLRLTLKKECDVRTFTAAAEALSLLKREGCDVMLLDLKIGNESGMDVLAQVKAIDSSIAVIMMTAYGSIGSSVEAMKKGAFTYLTKPLDIEELQIFVSQAVELKRLNEQVRFLSDELYACRNYQKIIGVSEPMQRVYRLIDKLKDADSNVLITGESGTGKELAAMAIHDAGSRKGERFVVINCAAISEEMLEIELFGYRRGAFAGAVRDRLGKFALADHGTLFLDQIGDMPLSLQSKLMRALENKEFSPLGEQELQHVDVRVIAATNKDMQTMLEKKTFREDLFYRLNVTQLHMPPLRERKEDIPLLCAYFLEQQTASKGRSPRGLSSEALLRLSAFSFPGNVRQLFNILEYAAIVSPSDVIRPEDFPEELQHNGPGFAPTSADEYLATTPLRQIERRAIAATLKKNGGRRDRTAEDLGISKRGLLNKINEYGITE